MKLFLALAIFICGLMIYSIYKEKKCHLKQVCVAVKVLRDSRYGPVGGNSRYDFRCECPEEDK